MTTLHKHQRSRLVWALLLLCSISLAAQEKPRKAQPQRPEFTPERIILSVTADPAHTQAATWRTERVESAAQGQIAEASANPDFEKSATVVSAKATEAEVSSGKRVGEYSVKFEGLKPNTQYSYRVGDGTTFSEWNTFRTASDKSDAFRFIYVGDAQNSIKSMWSRAIRAAYSKAPDARFIVHAGDLVQEGYDDNLWGEWCDAMGFISAEVPSLPTPGNHDEHRFPGSADSNEVLSVSPLWRYHFSLPANGPQGVPELNQQSYYLDYQGVRFVSIDANVYANEAFAPNERKRIADAQTAWIEKVLRDNPNRWTIIVQHQPIYTVSKDRDYEEMRAVLQPLYDKYHVDLVLQGHDHAYARTQKLFNGKAVSSAQDGTVYVISVSGPKMYDATGKFESLMAKEIHNTELFQVIDVDGNELTYRAYSTDGAVLDEFRLNKQLKTALLK